MNHRLIRQTAGPSGPHSKSSDEHPRLGREARRGRRAAIVLLALGAVALTGAGLAPTARAADTSRPGGVQSLDEQVQEIKSDVLAIAAELDNLEERLLYPSDTQLAVFVALDGDEGVSLDSAHVSIDGEPISHHLYSFKEIEALGKGGVQRLYTGNVRTGEHRIEVELKGKRRGGKDFAVVEGFTFRKDKEPKRVGITLRDRTAESLRVSIEDW